MTNSNDIPVLKVKRIDKRAIIPARMTEGSAGLDIYAIQRTTLWIGDTKEVKTGLVMEIPKGYHGEIHIRSSLGRRGIRLTNCTGIIDSDYRGEIIILLRNDSNMVWCLEEGDRIAQLILVKDPEFKIEEVSEETELTKTRRGRGGFGSTNKKQAKDPEDTIVNKE